MPDISKQEIKGLIARDNPVILDIGSYDGKDASLLSALYQRCHMHCFECDPRSQELFIKQNNNLKLHKVAVGAINGEIDLYQSDSATRRHYYDTPWSASSSTKKPKEHLQLFPDVSFKPATKVPCVKLDTWYNKNLYPVIIDFIWADVNGAEEDLIKGGINTLINHTIFFYTEFCETELFEGGLNKDQILKLLPSFELIGVYNYEGNFGNILLKNKNL